MTNVYYRLQYKSELQYLGPQLKQISCNGLFIPTTFFDNEKNKVTIKKNLKLIGKKIIIHTDYFKDFRHSIVPFYILKQYYKNAKTNERRERIESILEKRRTEINGLKKFIADPNNAVEYINHHYKEYLENKAFLESSDTSDSLLDNFLFNKEKQIVVGKFDFPFIPLLPTPDQFADNEDKIFFTHITELRRTFHAIQKKEVDFKEAYYNISITLDDVLNNSEYYEDELQEATFFPNIAIWIPEFNELKARKNEISAIQRLLNTLKESSDHIIFKYGGIFTSRLSNLIGDGIDTLLRIDGYPGLNINLQNLDISRNRRFLDPSDGVHLNISGIGERMEKPYSCSCPVCTRNGINSYQEAMKIYLVSDNLTKNKYYCKYVGNAMKTANSKLSGLQNQNIKIHCLYNLDVNLNTDLTKFRKKFKNFTNFSHWNDIFEQYK